ncbi:MAG: DUF4142 domain-containing protein [Candidatus Eremiobacteraeota bacterium]|nr:DUF4142 domain-containing protein [Candidatus Eremiobacteraeota bacterium]
MKHSAFIFAFAVAISGSPASAAVASSDADFLQTAEHRALGQYALAALAQKKASDPEAKALAGTVLADATAANAFLKNYAKSHDVAVDDRPSGIAGEQYSNISSESGSAFDRDFASALKLDVNVVSDDFKDEAQHGSDPALRAFAKRELATMGQIANQAGKVAH